jgi:competence protein ComEC
MPIDRIRLSPSKTLATFLAVFCFGILLGAFTNTLTTSTGLFLIIIPLAVGLITPNKKHRFILFIVAMLMLGVFRHHQALLPPNVSTVADHTNISTRVEGVIAAEVELREKSQRVVIDDIKVADQTVDGRVLVQLPLYPEVSYNDTLIFNCTLEIPEPFNGFAYDRYLASKGIFATCPFPQYVDVIDSDKFSIVGAVLSIKSFLLSKLDQLVPEPHSSFLSGLLFGGSSSLSAELKDDFSRTGTSHILAASGFNVSLFSLVFLGWILQTPLGRKRGLMLTGLLLIVYTITAGATPAVIRAAIMGLLVLIERWISRKALMLNVILFAGALMLFANPLLLLSDVGFQLSFVATTALLLYTKPLSEKLKFIPARLGLRESFSASLAAIIATLPIVIYHFGQVSLIAPIANLLILPLVPYAIGFGILALTISIVSVVAGTLFAAPAWALSLIMLWILTVLGATDVFVLSIELVSIVAVCSIMFLALLEIMRRKYVHS